jgi:hypothetical protein
MLSRLPQMLRLPDLDRRMAMDDVLAVVMRVREEPFANVLMLLVKERAGPDAALADGTQVSHCRGHSSSSALP